MIDSSTMSGQVIHQLRHHCLQMNFGSLFLAELTLRRTGPSDREREQIFFRQRSKISLSMLMPPCRAAIRLSLFVLAIALVCTAQTPEERMTGKSATGKVSWEVRSPADNRSSSTIWLWPDDQKDKATQLGGSQDAEPQAIEFSAEDAWILVERHLSSGSIFSFYRKQADGIYTEDKSAEAFFDDGEMDKVATSEQVDRSSVGFEKWAGGFGPNAFVFSWNARLSRRGPDTFFLLCRGWRGVYDLQKHAVVKTLVSARILTASEAEEEALNANYRQLRNLLDESGKENLRIEELAWLKKRDAIKNQQERLEFTSARVSELEDRMQKLRK
jgi:hypothetical protein